MIEVVSSILTNDISEAQELISRCEGVLERVSVDIIDGKFADDKTITPDQLSNIETDLNIDYHLMVIEPVNWIEKCIRGQVDRIIGHIEYMNGQTEFVGKAQESGVKVGLAVDLDTPIEKLDPLIITDLDVVLMMSVKAGFGGQEFNEKVIDKIRRLDEVRKNDDTPFKIHIDGGVTSDNIRKVIKNGADEVSVGRLLFKGDLAENIKKFKEKVSLG